MFELEAWTGRLIGKMHNAHVTRKDLAQELGVTKAYVSMVLNGARKPPNAKDRFEAAFEAVKKKEETHDP